MSAELRGQSLDIQPHEEDVVRAYIEARIERRPTGCIEWTGTIAAGGRPIAYTPGSSRVNRRRYYAYRVSWFLDRGQIPEGLNVLHRCDNPICVNVEHLFLGTKKDNTQDMLRKGRGVKPPVHRGEGHRSARFSDSEVRRVREMWSSGAYSSMAALAREVGAPYRPVVSWIKGEDRVPA